MNSTAADATATPIPASDRTAESISDSNRIDNQENLLYLAVGSLTALADAAVNWLNQLPSAQSCSLMGLDERQLAIVNKPFS